MSAGSLRNRSGRTRFCIPILAAVALALALPAGAQAAPKLLALAKEGNGTGTVTSTPAGIECGATCSASFAEGTSVILTGSPGAGTEAVKWAGCDSVSEGKCKVTMSGPRSVTATFKLKQLGLTVTKAGTGTGTVTSSPAGINCGVTCSAKFSEGSTVTLSGSPGANTQPAKWSGCDSVTGEGKCVVAMNAAKEVTATFSHLQFPLTVTKAGAGTGTVTSTPAGIECGGACAAGFDQGSSVTLAAVSGSHTLAVQWTGCGKVSAGKCEVTMSEARSVTATFNLEPGYALYLLTVAKSGTGAGTVTSSPAGIECGSACAAEFLTGSEVELEAVPAEGSVFKQWYGGGCTYEAVCKTKIGARAKKVTAVFTAIGSRALIVRAIGTGTVVSKPQGTGVECTGTCSYEPPVGTRYTLVATPAAGFTFTGWSGACSGTAPCRLHMSEAHGVTATFAKTPGPSSSGILKVAARAKVKGGKALLEVRCGGPSSCRGSLKLSAKPGGAKAKRVAIGGATYGLAPGFSETLKVSLSATAKELLKSTGRLQALVAGAGVKSHVVRLKAQGA